MYMHMAYNIYIDIPSVSCQVTIGKTLQLWCSEDMVRAVALVNEGMATSEAVRVCNVPRSGIPWRRHKVAIKKQVNFTT